MSDYVFYAEIVNASEYRKQNRGQAKLLYFPTDKETVKKTLENIGLSAGTANNNYIFKNYVSRLYDDTLPFPISADINELNELAKLIQGMDDYEAEVFFRAVDAKEHISDVADLINLAHNTECYNIVWDISSWDGVGAYYAEKAGFGKDDMGDLADYFDYEAYGKDYAAQNGGYFLGDVFLETNCADFTIEYDGNIQNLPKDSIVLETDADRLRENELDDAAQLSVYIDTTLRSYDKEYRDLYPDIEEAQEELCDSLIEYETVHIKDRHAKYDFPDAKDCMTQIAVFESKYAKDTFSLYQLKEGPDLHYHRFISLDRLHKDGLEVERGNYDLVYTAKLNENDNPESLFERFNLNRDKHFTGHSMSMSDILVIKRDGEEKAYYCDRIGFKEVPEFFDGSIDKANNVSRTQKPSVRRKLAVIAKIKSKREKEPNIKPPERSI